MAEKGTKGPGHTRITQTRLKRTTLSPDPNKRHPCTILTPYNGIKKEESHVFNMFKKSYNLNHEFAPRLRLNILEEEEDQGKNCEKKEIDE